MFNLGQFHDQQGQDDQHFLSLIVAELGYTLRHPSHFLWGFELLALVIFILLPRQISLPSTMKKCTHHDNLCGRLWPSHHDLHSTLQLLQRKVGSV